jgi:catechol 2,3-dioxygenase-like lactoylglutathione lyase family enzyme
MQHTGSRDKSALDILPHLMSETIRIRDCGLTWLLETDKLVVVPVMAHLIDRVKMKGASMEKKTPGKSSFAKIHHVGVVVKDIKKAIAYFESLGIGPFGESGRPATFTVPFKGELHGKPAEWKTTISNAKLGDVELELLEPTEGAQALKESLDKTGEGLHHIGFITDNLDREKANFKKNGIGIWTAGQAAGGPFFYSDPSPVGGLAVEFRTMVSPPKK